RRAGDSRGDESLSQRTARISGLCHRACLLFSPEYQRARRLRLAHSVCDFVIVEGYDGVQPHPPAMPPAAAARKGHLVGHGDVTDPEGYKAYMTADMVPFGKFAGRFLVRGSEFPSYRAALDCYRSADYQAAAALRKGKAQLDLLIIEGCEPQP